MNASTLPGRSFLSLSIALVAVLSAGCDQAPEGDPLADLPEVRSAVALDDLCDLASELRCAGAVGCCAESPYASVDECLAASSCEELVDSVTGSELFADGTISYDPDAAADLLAELAEATESCGTESAAPDLGAVFVGRRGEGEDCSPRDASEAHRLACAPGLACIVHDDEADGTRTGTCERPEASYTAEQDGPEPEPTVEALYCAAPPERISPRASTIVPTALSLNTENTTNAGTSANVTLHFIQDGKTTEYYCTITGGISKNQTKICTNVQTRTWGSAPSNDLFYVENQSNDGLAVDSVAVCLADDGSACTSTSSSFKAGTFDNGNTSMLESTIVWAFGMFDDGYDYFWVDGNSNGNCNMAKIKFDDDNTVNCSSHSH